MPRWRVGFCLDTSGAVPRSGGGLFSVVTFARSPNVRAAPQPMAGPRGPARSANRTRMVFLVGLLSCICFEGMGRKFLTQVPSLVFYFAKDLVLVTGLMMYGISKPIRAVVAKYFRMTPVL